MSKGNMLLGHARGKVGDLVFARTGGQQVVRARASQVKNPKTEAQTIQRILLNTIAQAYSKMSPIVDHSFQGVQQGQKTMSKFMADNLKALRAKVAAAPNFASVYAFSPIGTQVFSTNDYIVSTGTLPTIGATLSQSGLTGIITIPASDNTYAAVAETLGLQRGDQITVIGIEGSYLSARFKYARIILDPTNADGTSADWNAPFIDGGNINLPSARNEGDLASVLFVSDKISFTLSTPNSITSGAVIASRKNADGSWLRSSERLATIDPEELGENDLQSAIDQSEEGSVNTASKVYLNNAGTGRLQSVSTPSPAVANFSLFVDGSAVTPSGSDYLVALNKNIVVAGQLVNKPANVPEDALRVVLRKQRSTTFEVIGDVVNGLLVTSDANSITEAANYDILVMDIQDSNVVVDNIGTVVGSSN